MKAVIRLVIFALVMHATWRVGAAYWRYFQFQDGVKQTALFSGRRSDAELRTQVMTLAKAYEIPLAPDSVVVSRTDTNIIIDASYDERIEVLPRYFYPWHFRVDADAMTLVLKEAR